MTKIYLTALLGLMLLFSACGKDKDNNASTETKTPTQRLQANTWRKSEYKENGVVKPFFAACEMDDIITFKTDGTWVLNPGTNVCAFYTPTDSYSVLPDNKTMRWVSMYGEGELSFNSDYSSFTFKRTGGNTFEYIFVKN